MRIGHISRWAGGAAIAGGCLVLIGWLLDIPVLKQPLPGAASMKANTALAFTLAGGSLWLIFARSRLIGLGTGLASVVALIGLLSASEDFFRWDLGIDQMLFKDHGTLTAASPGRMAPTTAVCFLALGLALLISARRKHLGAVQTLAIASMLVSGLAFLGYLFDVGTLHGIPGYTTMAPHTASLLFALSLGLLFLNPETILARTILGDKLGGVMARRLLPVAILVPVTVGWIRLVGQRAGLYGTEFGLAITVGSTIAILSAFICWNAVILSNAEQKQREAEEALRRLNATLENRIEEKIGELTQSEAQLRLVIDKAYDAFVALDDRGRIVEWNPRAEIIFGWPRAEVLGQLAADVIVPERYRESYRRRLEHALDAGADPVFNERLELHALHRSRTEFPVEITTSAVKLGQSWRLNTFVRDLTAAKRAEEKFKGLLEAAPDAIVIVDKQGRIVLVNVQTEKLFGYERTALLQQPVELLIPQRFRDQHGSHRAGYFGDLRVRAMGAGRELYGIRKDGSEFPVEISLSPIETEEGTLVSSAIRDITARKQAEEAQARLAAIVESSEDAIFSKTLDGIVKTWNAGAKHLYGYDAEEIVGLPVSTFVPPNRIGELAEVIGRIVTGVQTERFETVRCRKDGTLVDVSVTISPIKDRSGRVIALATLARDITAAKVAHERIQASLAEKEVLLREIHHRVKNNMQVVSSLLSLQAESIQDELVRASLGESQARVRAMALLHETLYQANNLAGVDFARYINVLWEYVARTFGKTHGGITFQSRVEVPPIHIDQAAPCALILTELLSNALKYAFPEDAGFIEVELGTNENKGLLLRVSDNGVGFTEEDRRKATDRGALGLKLIDALCQQLGATYVWSGPGTIFTMTIG